MSLWPHWHSLGTFCGHWNDSGFYACSGDYGCKRVALTIAVSVILRRAQRAQRSLWITVMVRRLSIIGIMALAWLYYQSATSERSLASIGLVALSRPLSSPSTPWWIVLETRQPVWRIRWNAHWSHSWLLMLVLPELSDGPLETLQPLLILPVDPLTNAVVVSLGLNLDLCIDFTGNHLSTD